MQENEKKIGIVEHGLQLKSANIETPFEYNRGSAPLQETGRSLEECKDVIARKYTLGATWNEFISNKWKHDLLPLFDEVAELYAQSQQQPQWVSVEDVKPKCYTPYLCIIEHEGQRIYQVVVYQKYGQWSKFQGGITHIMNIPTPPKTK